MQKINNKEFEEFYRETIKGNTNMIKNIKINKKSVSVTVINPQFYFNGLRTERGLYKEILQVLALYYKQVMRVSYIDYSYLETVLTGYNIKKVYD